MKKIKLKSVENSKIYQRRALSKENLIVSDEENIDHNSINNNKSKEIKHTKSAYEQNHHHDHLQYQNINKHTFDKPNNYNTSHKSRREFNEPFYSEIKTIQSDRAQQQIQNNYLTNSIRTNQHNLVGYVESKNSDKTKVLQQGVDEKTANREKIKMELSESRKNVVEIIGCVYFYFFYQMMNLFI